MEKKHTVSRKRLYEIVEIGAATDRASRAYDIAYAVFLLANLIVTIGYTFDRLEDSCGAFLLTVEEITVLFFTVDYVLRLITSGYRYPEKSEKRALLSYIFSFLGIIDLLSFLPFYLPVFFPSGVAAFRKFRVIRIFRLFRINAYYDSLNVITEVLNSKKQQLMSSVFIIFVLMIASSMCMYSLENAAQPEVFRSAFSGIWWAVSTLLTVGYGDIYPITPLGRAFSIVITFLGVGMVAIPTGIISAGFVDQYSRIKRMSDYGMESDVHFIRVPISRNDSFSGKKVSELGLPGSVLVAAILRDGKVVVPRGSSQVKPGDVMIVAAQSAGDEKAVELKEITLSRSNPWTGHMIKNLDISRQTLIVLVHRGKESIIPDGNTVLLEGDKILMYTQTYIPDAEKIII